MTTFQDKGGRLSSSSVAYILIGLFFGQIAGANSVTLAKLFLYLTHGDFDNKRTVVETTLFLIMLFTLSGIAVAGRLSLKRGEPTVEQIALSTIAAVITALFTTIDQALPGLVEGRQPPWRTFYFLGWMSVFLLAPLFVLRSHYSLVLMLRLSIVAIVCFGTGYILIKIAGCLYEWFGWDFGSDFREPERFWLAKPSMLNVIGGAFFVAAFSPIRRFTESAASKLLDLRMYLWSGSFVVFTVIYGGIFGPVFYVEGAEWATKLVAANQVQKWQFFLPYAAFPVVVAVTAPLVFCQKGRFRWFLPLGLAFGFAVVVLLSFRPLLKDASSEYICFLTIAHAVNGALLGLILVISDGIADRLPSSDTKPL